ncbi:MAG: aspartate aminotransferase family protein, partial [Myxococcales bacterium]|nr:aspartate aminotransferase family protein [Myxococcales bacterium]
MDHATFRRHAHEIVDWMADYLEGIERRPVRSGVEPGSIASALPASAPQDGEPFADIMNDLDRIVMPGMTHWQHPRFFAYFPANATPPSILAEMITAALGAQCMLWQTSPAATEMETRLLDWLRQMIGLPDGFSGVIQDSASSAVLCAILTARERATGWQGNEMGLAAGPRLTAYASTETHSSVEKAVKIAGLGRNSLRAVALDDERRMDPEALDAGIRA